MESLFIINSTGDVFLEKHWRSVISKSICDYFLERLKSSQVKIRKFMDFYQDFGKSEKFPIDQSAVGFMSTDIT